MIIMTLSSMMLTSAGNILENKYKKLTSLRKGSAQVLIKNEPCRNEKRCHTRYRLDIVLKSDFTMKVSSLLFLSNSAMIVLLSKLKL